jgi:hypothetical protein
MLRIYKVGMILVYTSRTWRSGSLLISNRGVTQIWGLRQETFVAILIMGRSLGRGRIRIKSGWVVAYQESLMFASHINMMSAVFPTVFRMVFRVVVLHFLL